MRATSTKCTCCGGLLKRHSFGILKCPCCDEIYRIETEDINLLEKVNQLRLGNKFSEAFDVYREILALYPEFPEANWGALLSEYGVEYVDDGGKFIPTLHRPVQNYLITDDPYALNLLNNTSGEEHENYRRKITELEELRAQIETACAHLPKYDIFISCKITNPNSDVEEKTPEYAWGQQVYKQLCQKGFKVFFSPQSLPATNGAYEPIIYSALQSAKYLVVLASKIEYLESTWIKNEWSRFSELSKRTGACKYCKPVIDNAVAKKVPAILKEVSFIEHDDRSLWLSHLEKAVLNIFTDFTAIRYDAMSGGYFSVDLDAVEKRANKRFMSRTTIHRGADRYIVPSNPYTVKFVSLASDHETDANVDSCVRKVQIHLRNGKFQEARYELDAYLDFIGRASERDYQIILLELLINAKATSLDDFFAHAIFTYSDFGLFRIIVDQMSAAGAQTILKPLTQYIVDSVKNGLQNNAVEFLIMIANIKDDIIDGLHDTVVRSLPYMIEHPADLMKYADLSFPFIAATDIGTFIGLAQDLANVLCKHEAWDAAKQMAESVLAAEPQNSKCKLILLMVKYLSNTQEKLLAKIEESNDFQAIEDLIPELYVTGVANLVNIIKAHVNELITSGQFERATSWLEIVSNTNFEDHDLFFEAVIEMCRTNPDSDRVFSIAIHSLPEHRFDYMFDATLRFITVLLTNGRFSVAKAFCKEFSEYDTANLQILNYYLFAELESSTYALDDINRLKDMTIVERMLVNRSTVFEREELLTRLINACIRYITNHRVTDDDNLFGVFDKLLSYIPDLGEKRNVKKKINQFAKLCLDRGLFDKARWYYVTLIRIDVDFHEAYWGVLLAINHCATDDDLTMTSKRINEYPEYTLAVMSAKGDTDAENRYSNTFAAQLQQLRKRKLPKILLPILIAAAIVVLIIMLLAR